MLAVKVADRQTWLETAQTAHSGALTYALCRTSWEMECPNPLNFSPDLAQLGEAVLHLGEVPIRDPSPYAHGYAYAHGFLQWHCGHWHVGGLVGAFTGNDECCSSGSTDFGSNCSCEHIASSIRYLWKQSSLASRVRGEKEKQMSSGQCELRRGSRNNISTCSFTEKERGPEAQFLKPACPGIVPGKGRGGRSHPVEQSPTEEQT